MQTAFAETLGTIAGVIGVDAKRSPAKRGPQPKIAQQLQLIEALPKAQQKLVSQVIDSVLAQAAR